MGFFSHICRQVTASRKDRRESAATFLGSPRQRQGQLLGTEETIFDPLRKREVRLTPEERVRQWFIGVLKDSLGVPAHLMGSEVELKYGQAGKTYRADILVYDRSARPLAVVECKRPGIPLSEEVLRQALRYDMVLNVRYLFITNGTETRVARRLSDGSVAFLGKAPGYEEMIRP